MGKRRSVLDDLFEIAARLPWWAGVLLAAVSYGILHAFATPGAVDPPPSGVTDVSRVVRAQVMTTLASVFQYVLPLVFAGGAVASLVGDLKRRSLLERAKVDGAAAVRNMSWREFERLVGEAFRRRGYTVQETGAAGADGGIDLRLSRAGERYLVQCKHWRAQQVGVPVVRELYGAMAAEGAAGGFVVTSGRFTREAAQFASGRNIELIDGERLAGMIRDVRAAESAVQAPSSGASGAPRAPSSAAAAAAPTCPRCGSEMVRRVAMRGASAGKAFWGCSRFPSCRGTQPIG